MTDKKMPHRGQGKGYLRGSNDDDSTRARHDEHMGMLLSLAGDIAMLREQLVKIGAHLAKLVTLAEKQGGGHG